MIVEDGTGLTDSNSYVSVVFADDYFATRGYSAWAELEETQKEVLLIKATDYIDNIFQWHGNKLHKSQSLRFPRENLFDYEGLEVNGIPVCLQQSVCDAVEILNNGNDLFRQENENGMGTYEKIGDLAFRYAKTETQEIANKTLYEVLNTKLRGLYKNKTSNSIVKGVVKRAL